MVKLPVHETSDAMARAVKACLEGEIGPMVPASILRRHSECFLMLDREAASQLAPSTLAAASRMS